MSSDPRNEIYQHLHQNQMGRDEELSRHSARQILTMLRETIPFHSILDVGCGLGAWLAVGRELGATDVAGVEGPWLERDKTVIDSQLIQTVDLEKPFSLGRKFDLLLCLEVGEHLDAKAAPNLISSLVEHGSHVLFSAAIPFQGGHHHVNEQFLSYWIELFARHDFHPIDLLRGRLWADNSILWWLRQNIILFSHRSAIEASERLKAEHAVSRPISVVHPEIYMSRLNKAWTAAREAQQVMNLLSQGGTYTVVRNAEGKRVITRVSE